MVLVVGLDERGDIVACVVYLGLGGDEDVFDEAVDE